MWLRPLGLALALSAGMAAMAGHAKRAGVSEPGHPSHLRVSCRQRRRRAGAVFRRQAAADRQPHGDRRQQGGRRRQHRAGVRGQVEARRPHHLRPRRHGGCGQPAPVPQAAGGRRQGLPDRRDHQPAALDAAGGRQEPLQDRRRPDGRHEGEGRQGHLRHGRPHGPDHGRNLQERHGDHRGGGELQDRPGFLERDDQRQGRLRPARPGLLAVPAAGGPAQRSWP